MILLKKQALTIIELSARDVLLPNKFSLFCYLQKFAFNLFP